MKEQDKKLLRRTYKENPPDMGVFIIRNKMNDRCFVGSSPNLPGIFNRIKFELKIGTHKNKKLQADWKEWGLENFSFEVIDILERNPNFDMNYDYSSELAQLLNLWQEEYPFTYYND